MRGPVERRWLAAVCAVLAVATGVPAAAASAAEDRGWEVDAAYGDVGLARLDGVDNNGLVVDEDGRTYMLAQRRRDVVELVRLTEDGELDPSFGGDGFVTIPLVEFSYLELGSQMTSDGLRLVVSEWSTRTTPVRFHRFRLNGTVDPTFGDRGVASIDIRPYWMDVRDFTFGADQTIYASGHCTPNDIRLVPCVVSVTADGEPNVAFGGDGLKIWRDRRVRQASITSIAVNPEGTRIYVGGTVRSGWLIGAFRTTGHLHLGFGGDGSVTLQPGCGSREGALDHLDAEPTGALIGSGRTCGATGFARVTPAGAPDPAFGDDGWAVLDDGSSTMTSFYDPGSGSVYWLHGEPQGDLHVGAVRSDGTPDPAFGPDGELVIDLRPESDSFFWNLGIGLDGRGRLYGSAWYPSGDVEGPVVARAVEVEQ